MIEVALGRLPGLVSLGLGGVTLDGGDADAECTGRFGLGHASPDGIHDLPTEVFGVSFHRSMLPCGPSSSQRAVRAEAAAESNWWRLAVRKRETLGTAYARGTEMHPRREARRTTHAHSPHPLQCLGQRLAAEVPLFLVRELADGEVRLLLAGARSAEGRPKDLHLRSTRARIVRLTMYLARCRLPRLVQVTACLGS